jgi:hypothetical protein
VSAREITLVQGSRTTQVPGRVDTGSIRVGAADVERAWGWTLRAEGLCRGEVCVPVRDRARLVRDDGIALEELARATGLPYAADADEGVAVLGESAAARGARLASLEAPDFTLPDLAGKLHSLSQHRGRKVLLVTWASW